MSSHAIQSYRLSIEWARIEESEGEFSKEAIDMINQYLSEKKNEFMMIVAGYDDELDKCFFSYNPGLKRRFSSYYEIDKYSAEA